MKKFLMYTAALAFSSFIFTICGPMAMSIWMTRNAIEHHLNQEPHAHIIGDSHGYIFHDYPMSNLFVQKGMTLTCSLAKTELLLSKKIISRGDSVFLTIGAHNFTENTIEKRTGIDAIAKTRFQFFEALFREDYSFDFIVLGLKNIKLLVNGLELGDSVGKRPSGNRCGTQLEPINGHYIYTDGTIASELDPVEVAAMKSIVTICREQDVKLFIVPVPVSAEYKETTPAQLWTRYQELTTVTVPLAKNLTLPCEYFFDRDHLNRKGKELFFRNFQPDIYQVN